MDFYFESPGSIVSRPYLLFTTVKGLIALGYYLGGIYYLWVILFLLDIMIKILLP